MNKKLNPRLIVSIIGYVIVGLAAIFIAAVSVLRLNGDMTFIGRHALVWIMTDSMEDTIPAQSYILIERVSASDVKTDDIIVYKSDDPEIAGMLNTHRVIEIIGDNEEFVMKGDHNPTADKYNAMPDKIIGRYVKGLPRLSSFGRFLNTKTGILMSSTTIFALFVAILVPDMIRITNSRSEKQKKQRQDMIDRLVKEEVERMKAENSRPADDDAGDKEQQV